MNKDEKKLAKNILYHYYHSKHNKVLRFTDEENIILDRWDAHSIINRDAFHPTTSGSSGIDTYIQEVGYPFTLLGYEEYKKNLYFQFREGVIATGTRDMATAFAFIASIWLALKELGILP